MTLCLDHSYRSEKRKWEVGGEKEARNDKDASGEWVGSNWGNDREVSEVQFGTSNQFKEILWNKMELIDE